MEQTTLERRVRMIPATKDLAAQGTAGSHKKRVAAYCRVSTDSDEQLTSYQAQKASYTEKSRRIPIGRWLASLLTRASVEPG